MLESCTQKSIRNRLLGQKSVFCGNCQKQPRTGSGRVTNCLFRVEKHSATSVAREGERDRSTLPSLVILLCLELKCSACIVGILPRVRERDHYEDTQHCVRKPKVVGESNCHLGHCCRFGCNKVSKFASGLPTHFYPFCRMTNRGNSECILNSQVIERAYFYLSILYIWFICEVHFRVCSRKERLWLVWLGSLAGKCFELHIFENFIAINHAHLELSYVASIRAKTFQMYSLWMTTSKLHCNIEYSTELAISG